MDFLFLVLLLAGAVLVTAKITPPIIELQCTSKLLSVIVTSDTDFKGIVYIGDQARDCRMMGKGSQKLEISLPVRQCGIVTVKSEEDPKKVVHKVLIYLQIHPLLQQNSDIRIMQTCTAPADGSSSQLSVPEGKILDPDRQKVQLVAPSWMELLRGGRHDGPKIRAPVKVGETIGIIVKANVKGNQDSSVANCFASDGTSAEPEMFVDGNGCPVDTTVVPAFAKVTDAGADSSIQTHWTKFPAFKFPDRTRLYLTCQVVVCDFACPKPRCTSPVSGASVSRQKRQEVSPNDNWRQARVVDRVDVVNSLRVVNPDLEGLSQNDAIALEEGSANSNRVCWPLKSLMTAIGILAAILLICLLLALCFWWNRRQRKRRQFDSSYGTQTNSMYNPSTQYYSMHQYPESHQNSGTNGSHSEPAYAPTSSAVHGHNQHPAESRRFRDQSF
ncbi:hypothetical protein BV898_07123 [Hypsibius exemplaris]|uniref:ZP domain-containing protein n=1 Tax=Hypsibius exemplaris TaxID=2072580 RepID=A0A1W0WUI2_HYPEX|nr:hypothetical protein BV898_07123 [Hypsibius exemplaris]